MKDVTKARQQHYTNDTCPCLLVKDVTNARQQHHTNDTCPCLLVKDVTNARQQHHTNDTCPCLLVKGVAIVSITVQSIRGHLHRDDSCLLKLPEFTFMKINQEYLMMNWLLIGSMCIYNFI